MENLNQPTGDALDSLMLASVSGFNRKFGKYRSKEGEDAETAGVRVRQADLAKVRDSVAAKQKELWAKGRELMEAGKQDTPEYDELVKQNKFLSRKILFMEDAIKEVPEGNRPGWLPNDKAQEAVNDANFRRKTPEASEK